MEGKVVLKLDSIVKTFPGVRALDGVKLDIIEGEVHALSGAVQGEALDMHNLVAHIYGIRNFSEADGLGF